MDCSQGYPKYVFQNTSMQIYFNFHKNNFFFHRGDLVETDMQTVFYTNIKVLSVCIQNCQTKSCSHGYLKNSDGNTQAKLKLNFPNIIQHIYKHTIH